jgi:hypothetical protein
MSNMNRLAFYKAKKHLFNILVCWWTRGKYSHVEAIYEGPNSNEEYLCASSSGVDGGVRFKWMKLPADTWDIVDISFDHLDTKNWFTLHKGDKYDFLGLFGFVLRRGIQNKNKWFCSEAVAESLEMIDSWRFDPNTLYSVIMSNVVK